MLMILKGCDVFYHSPIMQVVEYNEVIAHSLHVASF